jgi:hypothetical protein
MYALVESGTITKYFNYPKGFTLGDLQYPADIFTKWSVEEKEAIGIHEVVFDDSNKKDEQWYINTNQSFAFAGGTVTASYGTATPKPHADSLYTSQDNTDGLIPDDKDVGDVKTRGLKYNLIQILKSQVANTLSETDWYVIRNTEKSTAIPSAISTHRDAVRTKQASMETQITGAADTAALETLYTYVNTGTESNPVHERPLGELPALES